MAAASVRKRVWQIITVARADDRASRLFDLFIIVLIVLNLAAVILETVPWIYAASPLFFDAFDAFSVAIFSLEYLARLWACTVEERYRRPFVGRLKFAVSPMMLIDLLAVAPFYAALMGDFRAVRALRLFRLFRVLKFARYSKAIRTFANVARAKREELFVALFIMVVAIILSSALMHHLEHEFQPDSFGSIPDAMWWAASTLTTVGYGDVHPMTPLGKLLGSMIAIIGIGLFALPAGILGSGFLEEMQRHRPRTNFCPHCGGDIHRHG
ncbi:ion transporter [bacterium]|nr:ion transporter [bacterium]